jgi:NADPH-dependent ferric siderophore reductase
VDRRAEAGAALPYFREMRIIAAKNVTPRMRRLTLAGNDLARFASHGIHIRLLLKPHPGAEIVWPIMGADGRQAWPDGERPALRIYTMRRIDVAAGEIEVDFVLHEGNGMPGSDFGQDAVPGTVVGMTGPGGGSLRAARNYLFLGDETALPAISRMLEELPADVTAKAFIEIEDDEERQPLAARPGIEVTWLSRQSRHAGTTTLLADTLSGLTLSDPDTYIWAGCEHAAARAIRDHLKSLGLPKGKSQISAYWRRGQAGEIED